MKFITQVLLPFFLVMVVIFTVMAIFQNGVSGLYQGFLATISIWVFGITFGVIISVGIIVVKWLGSGIFWTPGYEKRLEQISRMGHKIEEERMAEQRAGAVVKKQEADWGEFNKKLDEIRDHAKVTK